MKAWLKALGVAVGGAVMNATAQYLMGHFPPDYKAMAVVAAAAGLAAAAAFLHPSPLDKK